MPYLRSKRGRAGCAQRRRARDLVRRVAAQRDEVGNLRRLDAVARDDLRRVDPRHLAGADRIENRGAVGGKLERVAVAARDQDAAAAPLLGGGRGGEKIVRLVAGGLGVRKAACRDEVRQHLQLLDDGVVEFAPALIGRKRLVPIGRHLQRVPGDEHRARLLDAVEPQQEIREAENGAGRALPRASGWSSASA